MTLKTMMRLVTAITPSAVSDLLATREEQRQWAMAAAAGDEDAQRKIISTVHEKVRQVTRYTLRDADWAEDVSQNAMLKILHCIHQFRGDSSLQNWAARIALHHSIRALKKKRRRETLASLIPTRGWMAAPTETRADVGVIRLKIHHVLSTLPEKQMSVLILKHIHGYRVAEIANMLGVPKNTVRDRLRRGKATLKERMSKKPELKEWFWGE